MLTEFLTFDAQGNPQVAGNELAQGLSSGNCGLRTNAVLRKDEWVHMEDAVIQANLDRSVGVADLKSRGLVYDVANGLYTTVLQYETVGKMGRANVDMDAESQPQEDGQLFGIGYFPLPIIHKEFSINERVLGASRMGRSKLDTTQGEEAGRVVGEEKEIILFRGSNSFAFGGGTIYGYMDHPHRNLGDLTAAWGASGADPFGDVVAMKAALVAKGFHGPFALYVPTAYESALDANYVTGAAAVNITVRERILKIGGIESIKTADHLTAGSVILVQLTKNVVRMVTGMTMQMRQWTQNGGARTHFRALEIDIPQIRTDSANNCGVAHYSA